MTTKKSIILFIILVAIFPWLHSNFYKSSSWQQTYIEAPLEATMHKTGFKYIVLNKGEASAADLPIVRSLSNVWAGDGTQLANADEDGLDATNPDDIIGGYPFLAEILKTTPAGAHYIWWVDKSQIPEGTSGFSSQNTMFDIKIIDRVAPLSAPDDVANIPAYATITADGIGYYLLSPATEGAHPTLDDMVEVHYSGWQTDGTMFDSSVLRQKSNNFPLGRLITGWQKSIPLMRVGEKARIWIPGDLAYDLREDRPTAPKGMLVFDVELISISPVEAEAE